MRLSLQKLFLNSLFKIAAVSFLLALTSCLKTRSQIDGYQSPAYSKKQVENQQAQSNQASQSLEPKASSPIDEKDELIRQLNGRVEVLENQLNQLSKEKEQGHQADSQKIQLLQETLVKMEAQLARLENEANMKPSDSRVKTPAPKEPPTEKKGEALTDKQNLKTAKTEKVETTAHKGLNDFEKAQEQFAQKDFKNAILTYQKYVESYPKQAHVAEAKYKIGLSFESLGLKDEAQSFYEEVAAQFPQSAYGKKAKAKVTKSKK